jgi:hypothetical protein
MSLITVQEVKYLLNYTDDTYDVRIETLIPYVRDRAVRICDNKFTNADCKTTGDDFVFASATNPTITTTDEGYTEDNFKADMDVYISGTLLNDGFYTISTVTSTVMTLMVYDELKDEDIDDEDLNASIDITQVKWPDGIKPIIANMIRYDMIERAKRSGAKSERIGNYAITYMEGSTGVDYPGDIVAGLDIYTVPGIG